MNTRWNIWIVVAFLTPALSAISAAAGFHEVGPLPSQSAPRTWSPEGSLPAYRIESFGGTELEFTFEATQDDAVVTVEGPFHGPDYGDKTALGKGPLQLHTSQRTNGGNQLRVTLKEPGVFRLLLASDAPFSSRCLQHCARTALAPHELLAELHRTGKLARLLERSDKVLAKFVKDPELNARIDARLKKIAPLLPQGQALLPLERFPKVRPLYEFAPKFRPVLPSAEGRERWISRDTLVVEDFFAEMQKCEVNRAELPPELDPEIPGLRYGHFLDQSLTACQIAQSRKLALYLTSLAARAGSVVRYTNHARMRAGAVSPRGLLQALISSGHTVEVRNERTYANFLALALAGDDAFAGKDSQWPLWLDTGVALAPGKNLVVPMGHSQQTFYIRGPRVNAQVGFFLGISGVGFFPMVDKRPAWTGETIAYAVSSVKDREFVLRAADMATKYILRNHIETRDLELKHDGYGYLGVCNDSNAVVELAIKGTISTYPLLRFRGVPELMPEPDGLEKILESLPKDADVGASEVSSATYQKDVVRRVLAMTPHKLDSTLFIDDSLRKDLLLATEKFLR